MDTLTLKQLAKKVYNLSNAIREINGYPIQVTLKEIENIINGLNISDNLYINNLDGSVFRDEPFVLSCYTKVHVKTHDINKYTCQIR